MTYPRIDAAIHSYQMWSGRYLANFINLLNPIAFGSFQAYQVVPIFLLYGLIAAISYFIFQILRGSDLSTYHKLTIGMALSLIYIHNVPDIAQAFYWYTGAITYQLGNIFAFILMGNTVRILRDEQEHHGLKHFMNFVLIVLMIGCNEVVMLLACLALCATSFILIKQKHRSRNHLIAYTIVALICACVVIFAPGNAKREALFTDNHQLFYSLGMTILQTARFSFEWLASTPLIVASILFIPLSLRLSKSISFIGKSSAKHAIVAGIVLVLIPAICIFPPYWATGILGQHRSVNVGYLFFLIAWFANISIWTHRFTLAQEIHFTGWIRNCLMVFFVLGISFTGNGLNVLVDLISGQAQQYDRELSYRYRTLEEAKRTQASTVILSPLNVQPKTLFVLDIVENSDHWINTSYAKFFGIEGVPIRRK